MPFLRQEVSESGHRERILILVNTSTLYLLTSNCTIDGSLRTRWDNLGKHFSSGAFFSSFVVGGTPQKPKSIKAGLKFCPRDLDALAVLACPLLVRWSHNMLRGNQGGDQGITFEFRTSPIFKSPDTPPLELL